MMKWKELTNDPYKSVLRKEKEECRYWVWTGVDGCLMRKMKFCRVCPFYERREDDKH